MRLVRFNGGRIGILRSDRIQDITDLAGVNIDAWPPIAMLQVIANFDALRARLNSVQSRKVPLDTARLDAPVIWPHKIFAYPVNYVAHGAEMDSTNRANLNGFFLKASSSICGPNDAIVLPDLPDRQIHHECELAVVIGKRGRNIPRERAMDHVFGYSCLIDVTVRGKEERVMRKSYDTFTPLGPAVVTRDEVADPGALDMKLWVNDELRQSANTRDLIVDIPDMIATAARVATIEPGDVIATGTPAGVGPIVPGDTVTIEIEQVGRMSLNVVRQTTTAEA